MAQQVPFHIKSGIPFGRTIVVTLPDPRDFWPDGTSFEVLAQIRVGQDTASRLLLDMADFLMVVYTAPTTVTIDLDIPGSGTRLLTQSGYYDIVMSDIANLDANAVVLVSGPVYRTATVTADAAGLL
jgi:hypothetical protein